MDKKSVRRCLNINVNIAIITIFQTLFFMKQIKDTLLLTGSQGTGVLNDIRFTIFALKISITFGTDRQVYTIINYPFILLAFGILYNLYFYNKNYKKKEKIDSQ